MADREADFYEPIERCQRLQWDFVIRAYRDRALVEQSEHLKAAVAREVAAPAGGEPLHGWLLTSRSCESWTAVRRIVARYAARWWVEEYHKALKSGAKVEASQLERAYRLESLVAVRAVVAVRLLNAKHLARTRPDEPVDAAVFGPRALALLTARFGRPAEGWTHCTTLRAVAQLGGFLGRKHDGMPGWQTIWRGWQQLLWMCQGVELLQPKGKRCG